MIFSVLATIDKAYCIYKTNSKLCDDIKTKYGSTTMEAKTQEQLTSLDPAAGVNDIVVFVEAHTITTATLAHINVGTHVYMYLCDVTYTVGLNEEMMAIRPGFSYTGGPIKYKGTVSLTLSQMKAITSKGCHIQIGIDMNYEIHDSYDSMYPTSIDPAGHITFKPVYDSFTKTRLLVGKTTMIWGQTTFPAGNLDFGSLNVIISLDTGASQPGTPYALKGTGLYFDGSWGTAAGYFTADTGANVYVTATSPTYVTGGTIGVYAAYCIYPAAASATTGGCASLEPLKFGESFVTGMKDNAISGLNANALVSVDGSISIASDSEILSKFLLTDDAKTIEIAVTAAFTSSLDLRNPVWKFTSQTAPANLLAAPFAVTGNGLINPIIVKESTTTFASITGIAITSPDTFTLADPKITYSTGSPTIISPLFGDQAVVQLEEKKLTVNGAVIITGANQEIAITPLPQKTVSLSQVGTDIKLTLKTSGTVKFDSTWNTVGPDHQVKFAADSTPTIETKYPGIPPWLEVTVATQGTVDYVPDPAPKPKEKGLSDGAIAGIVIACIVVVAAIVVVVLNVTGVIHLCGKKKVEV